MCRPWQLHLSAPIAGAAKSAERNSRCSACPLSTSNSSSSSPSAPAGPPAGSSSQTCGSRGSCGRWGPEGGGQAGRLVSGQRLGGDDQDGRDSQLPGHSHMRCGTSVDCLPMFLTWRAQLILTAPWSRRRPLEMSWPRPAAWMGAMEHMVGTMAQQKSTAGRATLPTLLLNVQTSTQQIAQAPLPNPPLWSTRVKRWKARTTRPSLVFTCGASKHKVRINESAKKSRRSCQLAALPHRPTAEPICPAAATRTTSTAGPTIPSAPRPAGCPSRR